MEWHHKPGVAPQRDGALFIIYVHDKSYLAVSSLVLQDATCPDSVWTRTC